MVNNVDAQLNLIFGALADETRRSIITALIAGSKTINELAKPFEMSLPAILKHLKVLERASLIIRRKEGRVNHVELAPQAMTEVNEWIATYEAYWNDRFDALESYLSEEKDPK